MPSPRVLTGPDPYAKGGLMLLVANHLTPLFSKFCADRRFAQEMAISAIESYMPETRADYVNAARTIAFSMAALALLARADSNDILITEQNRAYSRAISLNRSADTSERSMMQRRRYMKANPPDQRNWLGDFPHAEPDPMSDDTTFPMSDDEVLKAAIAEAMAADQANRRETQPAPPEPAPSPSPTAMPPTMTRPAQPPAATPASAIRYTDAAAPRQPATQRDGLLRNSAIHRVVGENAVQHPS